MVQHLEYFHFVLFFSFRNFIFYSLCNGIGVLNIVLFYVLCYPEFMWVTFSILEHFLKTC